LQFVEGGKCREHRQQHREQRHQRNHGREGEAAGRQRQVILSKAVAQRARGFQPRKVPQGPHGLPPFLIRHGRYDAIAMNPVDPSVRATRTLAVTTSSAWEQDWRRRERGKALAVVRPGSTPKWRRGQGLRRRGCVHRAAGRQHRPGGGLGVPDTSGTQVVLSLQRMNACAPSTPPTSP
jgi:hypothetical protein